jgi:hypothetical protein
MQIVEAQKLLLEKRRGWMQSTRKANLAAVEDVEANEGVGGHEASAAAATVEER